jgi:N-acetylglucosaminyltransferase
MGLDFITMFPFLFISIVFLNRYFFGIFILLLQRRSPRFPNPIEPSIWPSVTVIIPLYNESEQIYKTLKSIAVQKYAEDKLQIMVVDDASKDDSLIWARKAAAEYPNITVIANSENIGKRLAIGKAVQLATSEFIVSVDSDVIVDQNAICELIKGFTDHKIAAVGGRVYVLNCHVNWLTKMQAIKYFFGYQYLKNLENAYSTVMCLSGCLTAYRRKVLLELEPILHGRHMFGVPIKYGEDRFLTRQILKAGYATRLCPDARCFTNAPTTVAGYFSQQLRWRRSNLVDLLGSMSHIWQLPWLVVLHYLSLHCILLAYPLFLWSSFFTGQFFHGTVTHLGILAVYGMVYHIQKRDSPEHLRVSGIHFLWMAFLMPVTYMVLSMLALLTLDSGSWETRQATQVKCTLS